MKRYFTLLLAIVAFIGTTSAQHVAQSILGAKVDVKSFEYQADSVCLNLEFNLQDLKIGSKDIVVFAPKLFKESKELDLPTLVIKSRGGSKSYKRAVALNNKSSLAEYDSLFATPYEVVDFYGGNDKKELLQYALTIPYETWMVESQLYIDCATYGCCEREDNGMLLPSDNQLAINIQEVETYQAVPLVEFVKPERVAIKRRDIAYSSALTFRVNSTYIDPKLANNQFEINSIDEMMQSVISDDDYTITQVNIIGYASPEGTLASNMKLSEGRAKALETLMKRKYKTIKPSLYNVSFGGENWAKVAELVEEREVSDKEEILEIIRNTSIENGREAKLMVLNGGVPYRYLLKNIFPDSRLVVVDVEYNVDAYDIVRIKELIHTKPQNLSLEEIYRLSETYEIEDEEFENIFLTAAKVYPDDDVALHNALVTEIRLGNTEKLNELAKGIDYNTQSAEIANTLGVYYMLVGKYDTAKELLIRAQNLGCERAEYNLSQLSTKVDNVRQQEESEALRRKIYGN